MYDIDDGNIKTATLWDIVGQRQRPFRKYPFITTVSRKPNNIRSLLYVM